MNIPTMIATVERLVRLENGLAAKRAAIATAASGPARVAAETALDKQLAAIEELEGALPTGRTESFMWLVRTVAEARVERGRLEREEDAATAAITAAQEAAKSQAWKWGQRKEATPAVPKDVAAAQATLAAVQEKLAALNKRVEPLVSLLKEEMQAEEEAAESAAWVARGYTDPVPAHILRAEEERRREFEAECITIKIPKNHAEWKEWLASRPVREPEPEPEVEMWDPADCMLARVLAGDFSAYYPKPAAEVAETVAEPKPARRSGLKPSSSTEWMRRVIAAKKSRGLAPNQVVPMGSS